MINLTLDVILPAFNESENILDIIKTINDKIGLDFSKVNLIIVDDGSKDKTTDLIQTIRPGNLAVDITLLKFSRNYGKDVAIKCGIDHSNADLCAIMDSDLQHPPEKIKEAAELIINGTDIVHIMKAEYNFGGIQKKLGSTAFEWVIERLIGHRIYLTDFKVISKPVVKSLKQFPERLIFAAGLISDIGFDSTSIPYTPNQRKAGVTKFTFIKLIKLAFNQILAVSIRPLRYAGLLGVLTSLFSFIYGSFLIFEKLFTDQVPNGFTTIAVAIFFMGGIQLIFLGLLGEYIGRTFIETKSRPQYILSKSKTISGHDLQKK